MVDFAAAVGSWGATKNGARVNQAGPATPVGPSSRLGCTAASTIWPSTLWNLQRVSVPKLLARSPSESRDPTLKSLNLAAPAHTRMVGFPHMRAPWVFTAVTQFFFTASGLVKRREPDPKSALRWRNVRNVLDPAGDLDAAVVFAAVHEPRSLR